MTLKCHDHKIKAEQLIPILMMSLLPFWALNVVVMLLSMQNYYVFLIQNLNWLTKFYQFIMSTIYIAHPQLTLMVSNPLSSEQKMLGRMPKLLFSINWKWMEITAVHYMQKSSLDILLNISLLVPQKKERQVLKQHKETDGFCF